MVAEATAPRRENVPSHILFHRIGNFVSYTIINAPHGSHCSGMEECRLRDPPQAENPVEQDSFLRKGSLVFLAKEQIPVQEADNDDTAEDIADGGRDQIVEDKGSDI